MTTTEPELKRWTAKRKTQLILEILKGKTTEAGATRRYDLKPSELQAWLDSRGWRCRGFVREGWRRPMIQPGIHHAVCTGAQRFGGEIYQDA